MINKPTYNTYGCITTNKNLIEHTTQPPATRSLDDISLQNLVNVVESIFKNDKLTFSDALISTLNATNLTVSGTSTMGTISSTKGSFDEICLNTNCIKKIDSFQIVPIVDSTVENPPSYYIKNYPSQVIREFKSNITIFTGLIKNNIVLETTILPDNTTVIQTINDSNTSYIRHIIPLNDTWGPWSWSGNSITRIVVYLFDLLQIMNIDVKLENDVSAPREGWTGHPSTGSYYNGTGTHNILTVEFKQIIPVKKIIIKHRVGTKDSKHHEIRPGNVFVRMKDLVVECYNGEVHVRTFMGNSTLTTQTESTFTFY